MKSGINCQKALFLLFFLTYGFITGNCQKIVADSATVIPFGRIFIYTDGSGQKSKLIVMISGDGGWRSGVPEFAKEFARTGSVVAGVDILKYYRHLRGLNTGCYHVFSDFVELATAVERKLGFENYIPPVIMGYSSGATLVYGILAQARPGTFMGGISLGFCPDFELPDMLCETNGLKEKVLKENKSYLLLPDRELGNPWIVLHGKADKVCDYKTVVDFVAATGNAKLISLNKVGHGFSRWNDFMPQWKDAYSELLGEFDSEDTTGNKPVSKEIISGLPIKLIKEKTGTRSNMITIMFSGDGGWYGFEESLSEHLGSYGIPVVGIDIKKYLWNKKSPERAATDVADLIKYYGSEWAKPDVMLFGYSQGAEILPFIYDRLPGDLKERVKYVVMLSPETTTDFEIHISNMLGLGSRKNTYEVIPEIKKDTRARQIIILGEEESPDMPDLLKNTGITFITVPGDHHYKGNATLIVEKLKESGIF